jgi:hypothetical protein
MTGQCMHLVSQNLSDGPSRAEHPEQRSVDRIDTSTQRRTARDDRQAAFNRSTVEKVDRHARLLRAHSRLDAVDPSISLDSTLT